MSKRSARPMVEDEFGQPTPRAQQVEPTPAEPPVPDSTQRKRAVKPQE